MRALCRVGILVRVLFPLLVLAVNVAAPIRTSTLLRVILSGPAETAPEKAPAAPALHFEVPAPTGVLLGFRAVVGLDEEEDDVLPESGTASALSAAASCRPSLRFLSLADDRSVILFRPPLRC